MTVEAMSDVEALGVGVPLIARVLDAAGVTIEEPSARAEVPVPA